MKRIVVLLFLALCIAGCHKHKPRGEVMITGFAAPEYKNKPLKAILVHARVDSLYFRDQLEKKMAAQISSASNNQTRGKKYLDLFPPIREYTSNEIEALLKELGISAVMFIDIAHSEKISSGWGFSGNRYGASGGSYSTSTRFTKANIEMYDASNKRIMWKGEGDLRIKGGTQKSFITTSTELARTIAPMLRRDGFYKTKEVEVKKVTETVTPKNTEATELPVN